MLADFILAVALICPKHNVVEVQEVLTTKPISYEVCDKMAHDDKVRAEYLPKYPADDGCDLDLICVRVRWEE